ncbi:hypothetical protein [Bacillus sp. AFS088145]|uniref:hypothetical protein n=1 Tax=Bacillus sp. AFS088145 TaxID=2033514 RepID=UPI000BF8314B|nr:hypothetical protein [Bacillus sp. AFS088145]PFH86335.1 hypothetical protein COI44_13100 [Bacillus sp. AFS088145]
MAVQRKFKKIVNQLRHQDLYKRAKGIDQLRKSLRSGASIESLIYLLEEAGSNFPKSIEDWDDGSYHLVGFCSEFELQELITPIEKNFEAYSERAKLQALYLLISLKSELARDAYIRIIEKNSKRYSLDIDVQFIFEETDWAPELVKKLIRLIENEETAVAIFHLILLCKRSSISLPFSSAENDYIIEQIKVLYKLKRDSYLNYNQDYNLKYVYQAWKESYLIVRTEMGIYLQLMQYYFDDSMHEYLNEALEYRDPYLKVDAVISLMEHGVQIEKEILDYCAHNIESAVWFYTKLNEFSKKDIYTFTEEHQHSFVKNRLFLYLITHEDFGVIPDEIEIIKRYDTSNYYEQEVTYYLTKFRSQQENWEENDWMAAYVGAYISEQIPSPRFYDETITAFTKWDKYTEDEHRAQLELLNKEENDKLGQEVILESKPSWHFGTYFLGFLTAVRTGTAFGNHDPIYFLLLALLWIIFLYKVYATIQLRKESKLILTSRQLTLKKGNELKSIELHKINRMTIELRKWGKNEGKMAAYQRKVNYIVFYDKDDEEILSIPSTFIKPDLLFLEIKLLTSHLVDSPTIEVFENDVSA